jgi:glycyl-tRNA synthetase beta chain
VASGASSEFLLEVGCEEIPAPWLPELAEQLRVRFAEAAERERLEPREVASWQTPRRLVVRARVCRRQAGREEQVWGPALKAARDASGRWTAAAEGFARKSGVEAEALSHGIKDPSKPGELYLCHLRRTPGRAAVDVLPGVIASVLRGLAFPKRMSWDAWLEDGKGAFPFGRPIRWLVALLDEAVVPFTIYGLESGGRGEPIVRSGERSYGHRFLPRGRAGQPIQVASLSDLQARLKDHFVLLDPAEREARIREGLGAAGGLGDDHGLPTEWRDLVEYPTVLVGTIPGEFRSLPIEVLETVLVHHQKYIPLTAEGRKAGRFAAVVNGDAASAAAIVRGMERVVVARLRDAAFFFREDLKRPLAERLDDLAGVAFHRGLGTYRDKADRLVRLVDAMGAELGLLTKPEHQAAREAALLCKADLTTLMVREFPELQGVMGSIYLRATGSIWDNVAAAVRWHYHPLSAEDGAPPARVLAGTDLAVFAAVSLADKLDTLAAYFLLGLGPKGSSDPFGLRRAALGAICVLLDLWNKDEAETAPDLKQLVELAAGGYKGLLSGFDQKAGAAVGSLRLFLLNRLEHVLTTRGFPADEVNAVMYPEDGPSDQAPGPQVFECLRNVQDCARRLRALHKVRSEAPADFEHLAVAFKRAKNILRQAASLGVVVRESQASLEFPEGPERALFEAVRGTRPPPSSGRAGAGPEQYERQLKSLASIRPAVDDFFEKVMVLADDPQVRQRRLELMNLTVKPVLRIADISKLGGIA